MTDSELRALIKASPAQGHRALYEQYANYVYAVIARCLADYGSKEDIEDCFVETFAAVLQHIDDIAGASLKAYIGTAARNRALALRGKLGWQKQNIMPLEDAPEPATQHVQEDLEQKELQKQLMQEIKALGEPDATILVQKYFYGRKMAEIGRMVGLTANTAQVRCSRALKQLRKKLSDWR